jgi:nucleotide-binding universal stress UspA family protein
MVATVRAAATRRVLILYATDFSPAAGPAFRTALAWARRRRARLHLVHVVTPPALFLEDSYLSAQAWRRLEAEGLRAARRRLAALQARARRAGVATSATVVRSAVPFSAIVQAARRAGAELIVLGTHGRTGLARVALGSVAERVVALAPCPVLTVRG